MEDKYFTNEWHIFWRWYLKFIVVMNSVFIIGAFAIDLLLGDFLDSGFYSGKYVVFVVLGFMFFVFVLIFNIRSTTTVFDVVRIAKCSSKYDKGMLFIWFLTIFIVPFLLSSTYFLGLKGFISGGLATLNLPMIILCSPARIEVVLERDRKSEEMEVKLQ